MMLLFGLGRGIFAFPFLLLSQYADRVEDARALNMWICLGILGQAIGYFLGFVMTIYLEWNWQVSLQIINFIYLLTGVLVHFMID